MSESELLRHFCKTRDEFHSNALKAIASREYRKASELLWGAVTQQLKALAANSNVLIETHGKFFDFLRHLSAEISDESLLREFVDLNALHKNFYDETIPPEVFPRFLQKADRFIGRLDRLIKQRTASSIQAE